MPSLSCQERRPNAAIEFNGENWSSMRSKSRLMRSFTSSAVSGRLGTTSLAVGLMNFSLELECTLLQKLLPEKKTDSRQRTAPNSHLAWAHGATRNRGRPGIQHSPPQPE